MMRRPLTSLELSQEDISEFNKALTKRWEKLAEGAALGERKEEGLLEVRLPEYRERMRSSSGMSNIGDEGPPSN